MDLYDNLFSSPKVSEIFSTTATLAQMLRAEAALAQAQATCGLFPQHLADAIVSCCKVELLEVEQLKADIRLGGNAAIPLVKQLTALVQKIDPDAAKFVHFGATSQDIIDTATAVQFSDFINWLEIKTGTLESVLVQMTRQHRNTVMAGRTLLQQAKPITFGLKTVGWLESISRSKSRILAIKKEVLVAQLSGAVGNGNEQINAAVRAAYAQNLNLHLAHSRHTHRDMQAEMAAVWGILTGSLGKIAKDISLLMQTEIGEVSEGAVAGKGGSSTMPHKRNPITCAAILANAHRTPFLVATILGAMPQENERSAGLWHAEWPVIAEIATLTGGALENAIDLLQHLQIDAQRMRQNLEITGGLIFSENVALALAAKMGKSAAHALVENACKTAVTQQKHLKTVISDLQTGLSETELEMLFNPENSIGNSFEIIDDILKNYEHQL